MADVIRADKTAPSQEEYWNCVCIPLTRGQHTIIDIEDYESVIRWRWHTVPTDCESYYASSTRWVGKKDVSCKMHRFLLNAKQGEIVDHINRNALDNRRSNLRFVSSMQNAHNRSPAKSSSSKFKGVGVTLRVKNPWCAKICANKRNFHLGVFRTEIEAALAYNEAAKLYHGEYAVLNDIPNVITTIEGNR